MPNSYTHRRHLDSGDFLREREKNAVKCLNKFRLKRNKVLICHNGYYRIASSCLSLFTFLCLCCALFCCVFLGLIV